MENIELLLIKEIPFETNREFGNLSTDIVKNVRFSFLIVLQYQDESDTVGLHTVVRYIAPSGEMLLQGGATFIARIKDWNKIAINEENIKNATSVKNLVAYSSAFVSGMFFKRNAGTLFNSTFIPNIPSEQLVAGMKIEKIEK